MLLHFSGGFYGFLMSLLKSSCNIIFWWSNSHICWCNIYKHGRWLLKGNINTYNDVSPCLQLMHTCFDGQWVFVCSLKVIKFQILRIIDPKCRFQMSVKYRLTDQYDSPLNPKTVLTSSEHEIHSYYMSRHVFAVPSDLL